MPPRKTATKDKSTRKARQKGAPKKIGRPSVYSDKIAERICDELAQGKGLRQVCAADDMPSRSTVLRWLRENETFQSQYARAKEFAVEAIVDDIIEIADDASNDFTTDDEGNLKFNSENVQRSRLRIDSRKWIAAKLKPKKYGDKLDMNHDVQPGGLFAEIIAASQGTALPVASPSAGAEE